MTPSQRLKELHAISRLDPIFVQNAISELLLKHPDLLEDEILRADVIEGETDAFDFIAQVVREIGGAKILELGSAAYIAELQSRKARFERRQDALRELLLKVMQSAQLSKVELAEATVSVRQGPAKVMIVDETQIPEDYLRIVSTPDKIKIREALVANEPVPGAMLSNREPVLAIHSK
jgi:hypothetical protein